MMACLDLGEFVKREEPADTGVEGNRMSTKMSIIEESQAVG